MAAKPSAKLHHVRTLRARPSLSKVAAALVIGTLALSAMACDNNGPRLKPLIGSTTTIAPTTTTTTIPVPTVIEDIVVSEIGGCAEGASTPGSSGCRTLTLLADGTWTLLGSTSDEPIDEGTLEEETRDVVLGGFSLSDLGLLSTINCVDQAPVDGIDTTVSVSGDGVITAICDDAFGIDPSFSAALESLYVATGWTE